MNQTQTEEQIELLNNLELALAGMVYNKEDLWADRWGKIIEYLQKGECEVAVLEGESLGVDEIILNEIRKTFDVRY